MAFGPSRGTQDLFYTSYANGGQLRRLAYTAAANRAPTATLSAAPSSGAAPLAARLNGTGSSDPEGGALRYFWSFGDGTPDRITTGPTFTHSYAAGRWTATLRVLDPKGAVSAAATTTITSGDRAPSVSITAPADGAVFVSGRSYRLRATATDPEDGALPASALTWTVQRRHAEHTHPFLGPLTGNDLAFTAPGPEDLAAAANSDLLISVTATDSDGVSATATRTFSPQKVSVTLVTEPAGRTVVVNGSEVRGGTSVVSWAGSALQLEVPDQTDASGTAYRFSSWSDGGAASHSVVTPLSGTTLTATLVALPRAPTVVTGSAGSGDTATLSWSPPAGTGGPAIVTVP